MKEEQIVKTETGTTQPVRRRPVFSPAVDIVETSEEVVLRADLPGVDEKSIDCTVEAGVLTIRAETTDPVPDQLRLLDGEYTPGDFERAFALSDEIDEANIRASVKNGVLELHLPKAGHAQTRKIEIQTE